MKSETLLDSLRKVCMKRFEQNQAIWQQRLEFKRIIRKEGEWSGPVQTLAEIRTSRKPRTRFKERQAQITVVLWTVSLTRNQTQCYWPQMCTPPPLHPDLLCPASRSVTWEGKPWVCVLISFSLLPFGKVRAQGCGGKQRVKGGAYLACTLMLRSQ